jgi:hypothetical protein
MENLIENLTAQNTELEIKIKKILETIRQIVLSEYMVAQEHLFSEEAEFLNQEDKLEILLESIKVKKKLIDKLDKARRSL